MTVIDQYIKLLVRAVKKNDVFKATRFICGYSNKEVESPVTDFLVAVTTDNIEINNSFIGNLVGDGLQGEELKVIVRFRVYAPFEEGGSGLTEHTNILFNEIKNADLDDLIVDGEVSAIEFDRNTNAISRSIKITLDFCLCEEIQK